MLRHGRVRQVLVSREVVAAFGALVAFYAVANLVVEPFGTPLEPVAELLFVGYWALRHEFLVGGFLTQILLTWLWFAVYAYLLAVVVGAGYRWTRARMRS